ncbi:hypothetical protein FQN49_007989 [Arthroderma sp. PD_2]|nr:hypothetical protein FQN49_007989 [Arthroderma sp. PD_2]
MVRRGIGLPLVGLLACMADLVASTLPMRDLSSPQEQACPEMCRVAGMNPANWTVVAGFDQLSACSRPILMDFSLDIPTTERQFIRTCDTWGTYYYHTPAPSIRVASEEETSSVAPQLAWSPAGSMSTRAGHRAITAAEEIQSHLQRAPTAWDKTVLFSAFGGATVGVYIGENILNPSVADNLFKPFMDKIRTVGIDSSKSALLQVCGQNRTGDQTFGVIASANSDLSTVQAAVKSWVNATCVDTSI